MLKVLQRQVLQLALQLVETQLVGQRGIEVAGLLAYLQLGLHVLRVADLPHQVHAVGNHDENHAHVLGERQQQVAEVLTLDDGVLLVEVLDAHQSADDGCHLLAEIRLHLFQRQRAVGHARVEQDGQHTVALQPFLFYGQHGGLHALMDRVEAEHVALHPIVLQQPFHVGMHLRLVALLERCGKDVLQLVEQFQRFRFFLFGENQTFFHSMCKSTELFGKTELFEGVFRLQDRKNGRETPRRHI